MAALNTSAHAAEPEDSRPVTLAEAAGSIAHKEKEWHNSAPPSPAAWAKLSSRLARADMAIGAIAGLHDVSRQHHFAEQVARESEVEYTGLNDYQAGCINDAIRVLTWDVLNALDDLREAVSTKGGR